MIQTQSESHIHESIPVLYKLQLLGQRLGGSKRGACKIRSQHKGGVHGTQVLVPVARGRLRRACCRRVADCGARFTLQQGVTLRLTLLSSQARRCPSEANGSWSMPEYPS